MRQTRVVDGALMSGESVEFEPADLGLTDVDLKAVAATVGKIIRVAGMRTFMATEKYVIAGTTPTVGTVILKLDGFLADGVTQIFGPVTILTLSSTEAAATRYTGSAWGEGTAGKFGTGTITAANFDVLKGLQYIRLTLDVTVAYDAAGAKTASVYLSGSC